MQNNVIINLQNSIKNTNNKQIYKDEAMTNQVLNAENINIDLQISKGEGCSW